VRQWMCGLRWLHTKVELLHMDLEPRHMGVAGGGSGSSANSSSRGDSSSADRGAGLQASIINMGCAHCLSLKSCRVH
jgi:hypothetical protein